MGTREKIVAAATEIMREDSGAQVSVRAVAARAGVGASTLRHHFPSQRALFDAVVTTIYEQALPDDRIRDTTLPARHRLAGCLRNMLTPVGSATQARTLWVTLFRTFIDSEATAEAQTAYLVFTLKALQRIESWLPTARPRPPPGRAGRGAAGALPAGDDARRARYLLTVVNGLSIERALPTDGAAGDHESEALEDAVDALFAAGGRAPTHR